MPSNKRRVFTGSAHYEQLGMPNCPICRTPGAEFFSFRDPAMTSDSLRGWCRACTNVFISRDVMQEALNNRQGHLVSAYFRRLPESDANTPLEDVGKAIGSITELGILDQFDLALKTICDMCSIIGQTSHFDYEVDWPLLTVQSAETALFIIRELANAGFLDRDFQGSMFPLRPTWNAYQRLQEIQASGKNSHTGFVAMSFAPDQNHVYTNVIKSAIEDAGYKPFRVDQVEHNNRIDDEIIAGIRRSRFLVADFTGQRNGVYFEAGMALGLGRNVIWMCHDSDRKNLHFDTRQFNHIIYTDLPGARKLLANRIVALEGQGNYLPLDKPD
jgi:nucleoside 2-deoxyribosyltransferase